MIALVGVLVALAIAVAFGVFMLMLPAPEGSAADDFVAAHHLGDDADTRRAIARYVARTRNFARRGMVLGILVAFVLGLAWYQQLSVGFGRAPSAISSPWVSAGGSSASCCRLGTGGGRRPTAPASRPSPPQ